MAQGHEGFDLEQLLNIEVSQERVEKLRQWTKFDDPTMTPEVEDYFYRVRMIKELGPVITALLFAGRAGTSLASEIGLMKATDQLSAMEMMAVNPLKHIVTPKILAGLISLPLLTTIFDLVGIGGGYLIGVKLLGVNEGAYFGEMVRAVEFLDIYGGFVKSLVNGLIITWVCSFIGYTAVATTEGVARATTNAVVTTSVLILIMDYILTSFLL